MSQFGSILRFAFLTCLVPMESTEVSTTTDHKLFALFTLDGNHETDGIIAVHLEKEVFFNVLTQSGLIKNPFRFSTPLPCFLKSLSWWLKINKIVSTIFDKSAENRENQLKSIQSAFRSARFLERTLSGAHAFWNARFLERTLSGAHAFFERRLFERTLSGAHTFRSARFLECLLSGVHAFRSACFPERTLFRAHAL